MKTNDIKKGQRVKLRNGWEGTMADNARGNTRMVRVEGFYTETGSVYSHDIVAVQTQSGEMDTGLEWTSVEHTPAQLKLRKLVA